MRFERAKFSKNNQQDKINYMTENIRGNVADLLAEPDCLKCMRKKLNATSVVVFFCDAGTWRVSSYQSEKPASDAEIDFYCLLNAGIPQVISSHPEGLILPDDRALAQVFGQSANLLSGNAVIAAPVTGNSMAGVRLAWRDNSSPFTEDDLVTVHCVGDCPPDCR